MIRKLSGPLSELFKKVVKKAGMGTGDFLTRRRPGGRKKVVKKSWYGSALLWHSVCGGLNINCGNIKVAKTSKYGSLFVGIQSVVGWSKIDLRSDQKQWWGALFANQSRFDTESVTFWYVCDGLDGNLTYRNKLIHRVRLKGLPITIDQSSDQNNDESWRAIIVC